MIIYFQAMSGKEKSQATNANTTILRQMAQLEYKPIKLNAHGLSQEMPFALINQEMLQ